MSIVYYIWDTKILLVIVAVCLANELINTVGRFRAAKRAK